MSGSVSPLPWTGSKGCIYTTIDAFMPPHKTYVEPCMGSAEVFLRKKPSEREIINDYNGDLVKFFRVLQRSEKLAYLIGRLSQITMSTSSNVPVFVGEGIYLSSKQSNRISIYE